MLPVIIYSDDAAARRHLLAILASAGWPETAAAGSRPVPSPATSPPGAPDRCIVIVDLGQEPADGLDWCRSARAAWPSLPICAVTRAGDPALEVTALEQGADAVVVEPVGPRRLTAQLRALERPLGATEAAGDLSLDAPRRLVVAGGRVVGLTDAEFAVLAVLFRHRGRVVSRDELSAELRARPCDAGDRSLDLRVARLRRKLGDDARTPRWIRAVRGEGYLLLPPSP